jgi:hypothetical protein
MITSDMDHLPIPESCKSRIIVVPYLGLAPQYDRKGFHGFPERHGLVSSQIAKRTLDEINNPTIESIEKAFGREGAPPPTRAYAESFLQEWLWFGLLHEFEIACDLPMNTNDFIRPDISGSGRTINTEPLLRYVRVAAVRQLEKHEVPLDLKIGDSVYLKERESQLEPCQIEKDLGNFQYAVYLPRTDMRLEDVAASRLKRDVEPKSSIDPVTSRDTLLASPWAVLQRLILDSRAHEPRYESLSTMRSQSRIAECLREVRKITSEADMILRFEVISSIDILYESLSSAASELLLERRPESSLASYTFRVEKRMKERNWCLARAWALPGGTMLSYIGSLLSSHESVSHRDCGKKICSQRPETVEGLQAKHNAEQCDGTCLVKVFDEDDLIRVLTAGGIPGISETRNSQGEMRYEIVNTTEREYIAISHVWSHGLGNPSKNALPLCQIQLLFKQIRAIASPDVVLWIDTISVPIKPKWKSKAIRKLRDVYSKANKVLVIDRHLQQVASNWLEQCLQLLASEWMQRLWTLQEGRLASELYIQFKDKAVSILELSDMGPDIHIGTDTYISNDIRRHVGKEIRARFAKQEKGSRRFWDLIADLSCRSVTVASDEPICIATLLGLSLEQFDPFPTMEDIYRSLSSPPQDILFVDSPRLTSLGYRWAPATFLKRDTMRSTAVEEPATILEEGLKVCKDCVVFTDGLQISEHSESSTGLNYVQQNGKDEFLFARWHLKEEAPSQSYGTAALIFQNGISTLRSCAVLVSNLIERDGIVYCHFEYHIYVLRVNESTSRSIKVFERASFHEPSITQGEIRSKVTFCID